MEKEIKRLQNKGQRYSIIEGGMGSYGDPDYYPTHKYEICSGKSFYCSITCALEENFLSEEGRKNLIDFLDKEGYSQYLKDLTK